MAFDSILLLKKGITKKGKDYYYTKTDKTITIKEGTWLNIFITNKGGSIMCELNNVEITEEEDDELF